jgi:hypothetical protein
MALDSPSQPVVARPPVLILASRESGGSLLAGLLGAHPDFADAPQLNVLAFEQPWQLVRYAAIPRDSNIHGLLRFLAQELMGEQSVQAVQAAQRWLARRGEQPAAEVHAELRALVAPRRLVDYSPLVAFEPEAMRRAVAAAPDATVIHLTSDPRAHGRAMSLPVWQSLLLSLDYWDRRGRYQAVMDVFEIGEQLVDWSTTPPIFDPQFAWYRTQRAARDLLAELPAGRGVHLRLETLLADPETTLASLLDRLGANSSESAVRGMTNAVPSVYAGPGPYTAPFGVDFGVLDPSVPSVLSDRAAPPRSGRSAPLPWRGDGGALLAEVVTLAEELGYTFDD